MLRKLRLEYTGFLALLILPLSARAANAGIAQRLDELLNGTCKAGAPGFSVAVIQHGKPVYEKGFGLANLEYDIPVRPQTIYHVASVSKQFTAMALVLLEQDGKLSLEDDVHKYLPELPDYGHPVTIRQLLQHTSGIRDQWQTLALAGWRLDDVITQDQILRVLFRQKELNFVPGTRHLYSNGGYTLAAEIVTRVAGKPFPDFCRERIFNPLGMAHTHFHIDHRRIVHDRAYSYSKSEHGYEAEPLNYANVGATSLFTTAPDLTRWLDNFRDFKVGGRRALDRLQEQAVLADGTKIGYALGVEIGKHGGSRTVSHAGGDAGYRSFVVWFPDQELGVAVLSGLASFDCSGTAFKAAETVLGTHPAAEANKAPAPAAAGPKPKYVKLESRMLKQFAGAYKLDAGLIANFLEKDGVLVAEVPGQGTVQLHPLATNRFFVEMPEGELEFSAQSDGGMRLKFAHVNGRKVTGERIAKGPWAPKDLEDFQGVYWSGELETQYTIKLKEGKLTAEHIRHGTIDLVPLMPDRFAAQAWFMAEVKFQRDSSGKVTGMTLGGGRITGILFKRKPA
ncbi:MAG TPA: serine hydrolase domain-containing protein [Candidatus Acidoferrum sp.]|nr:serine hydrolase domain-containing protein [Candidatus Acidoferrum sp.]